jgi:hypothetical protein
MHNEYDKAEAVFTQLLTISPNASELYWDLVLCKYGVTYVCDPKTGKYIPTCNRTHYTSVFKDENYLKATGLASGEKLQLYKDDAATIDNIQKGILAVSKKEKPFDIFISYKETDANGNVKKITRFEEWRKRPESYFSAFAALSLDEFLYTNSNYFYLFKGKRTDWTDYVRTDKGKLVVATDENGNQLIETDTNGETETFKKSGNPKYIYAETELTSFVPGYEWMPINPKLEETETEVVSEVESEIESESEIAVESGSENESAADTESASPVESES